MTNEKQLSEWIKEAMSGMVLKSEAEKLAPVIARYIFVKLKGEMRNEN